MFQEPTWYQWLLALVIIAVVVYILYRATDNLSQSIDEFAESDEFKALKDRTLEELQEEMVHKKKVKQALKEAELANARRGIAPRDKDGNPRF